MKKLLFLFACMTTFSCEQLAEDDQNFTRTFKPSLSSENQEYVPTDFDPLDQLTGIPVNIVNVGNTKNKYLSAQSSGNKIVLASKDDGSLRQRWFI